MPPAGASLVLRHHRADMAILSDWISQRFAVLGLTGAVAYAVRLCLEEAVLNIMTHNVPQAGLAPEIAVHLDRAQGGVSVEIADHGSPFDPLSYVPRPPAGSAQDAPLGGFGIRLMRHYSQTMSYRRECGTNHLAMRFDQDA